MMSFSIFLIKNIIKVSFLLISIKLISSFEFDRNTEKKVNYTANKYYSLTNAIHEKTKNDEDSTSIFDNLSYNEVLELKVRIKKSIDRIILYESPTVLGYVDIMVNNELIDEVIDDYDHQHKIYTIYFKHAVPANSNLYIKFYFKELSLLTLKDLFQLDFITLTNDGSVDSKNKYRGISLSTHFLAAFVSELRFTKLVDTNSILWKFQCDKNDISRNSLLEIIYKTQRYFKMLFAEDYQLPALNAFYTLDSIINTSNFSEIDAVSTKTLQETNKIFDQGKKQRFTSNLLREWSYMYLNSMRSNLKDSEWIVEGLANYFKYYGISQYEPISKIHRRFIEEHLQPALTADASKLTDSIMSWNRISANISQDSRKTSDSKVSSLLRMLHLTFGLPILRHGIDEFYKIGKGTGVSLNDLWYFLQKEIFFVEDINLDLSIKTIMASWIDQAGYPLLTVDVNGCDVKLHQSRFFWQQVNNNVSQSDQSIWWIPITWITKQTLNLKSTAPVYWLNTTEDKIMIPKEVNNDWIIFNSARTGFYRVNYDKRSWEHILNTLNSKSLNDIPVIDRMTIIDDIISLAKTGHISIDIYLRGLEYIEREIYSGPLKIVLKEFINLHEYYSDSKDSEDIDELIFNVLEWAYDALGYTNKPTDDISFISFRTDLNFLMDDIKFKKCVRSIQDYWKKIFKNTKTKEEIENESYNYCSSSNEKLEQYNRINLDKLSPLSAVERPLSGLLLFCIQTSSHQNKLLKQTKTELKINDELNSQVIKKLTVTMEETGNCQNKGIQLVLNYLIQYPKLMKYYCKNEQLLFLDLISVFSQKLIKPTNILNQLEQFTNASSLECSKVAKSLSIIRENEDFENKFYETNRNSIVKWTKKYNDDLKKYGFYKYLLSNDISPIHYVIELTPHMVPNNYYFNGKVTITAQVIHETSEIRIHFYNLIHHSISLEVDGQDVAIAHINNYKKYQYLEIQTSSTLKAHSIIAIKIQYTGNIGREKRGLYRDFYINNLNEIKWFAATYLEHASARRLFPCFDEPFFKATFQLILKRSAGFRTVSNTKLKSTLDDNGQYIDVFEKTSEISTHEIAFVLSEFDSPTQVSENFIWFTQNSTLDLIYPIIQTRDFFNSIEKLVNSDNPYNYKYLDELEQLKNQVENYDLIAYKGKNVIINSNYVSLLDKLTYIINWNYRMMYRFFKNYISIDFWRCEWFTRSISYHFLSVGYENNINSKTEGSALFVVHYLQPSMLIDASPSGTAILQDDYTPEQINNMYNKFTDDKGASILRMIEGTSVYLDTTHFFQEFVVNAVSQKRKSSSYVPKWGDCPGINLFCEMINTNTFSNTSSSYSNCILKSWLSQRGFPVVHVTIKNDTAIVSQSPFQYSLSSGINLESLWNIPITWTSSENPNFSATKRIFFLNKQEDSFKIHKIDDNGWMIFNLQQIGYYRVNYELTMWDQIKRTLASRSFIIIHENNRAAIIDDLLNLARGGYVNYTMALSTAKYLVQEKNYAPWRAALVNFAFLDKRLTAVPHIHEYFKIYVKKLIKPAYNKLGFKEQDDEGYSKSLLRINILEWACKYEELSCILECQKLFNNWINSSKNIIPVNIRSIVYCTTIRSGSEVEWELLFNTYLNTNCQNEKDRIIKALACVKKPKLLQKLLLYSIIENSKFKIQDSLNIFSAVYSSGDTGIKTTLSFISIHFNKILGYFNNYDIIESILKDLVVHISTPELVNEFEIFVQKIGNEFLPIKETIFLCIAQAQEEILWHNSYFSTIAKFLEENNNLEISDEKDVNNDLLPIQ